MDLRSVSAPWIFGQALLGQQAQRAAEYMEEQNDHSRNIKVAALTPFSGLNNKAS